MGIEKYFQKVNSKNQKKADSKDADSDFQAPVKSKIASKKKNEAKEVDPKLFFSSSSKQKENTVPKEVKEPKVDKASLSKEVDKQKENETPPTTGRKRKTAVVDISDNEVDVPIADKKQRLTKKQVVAKESKEVNKEEKKHSPIVKKGKSASKDKQKYEEEEEYKKVEKHEEAAEKEHKEEEKAKKVATKKVKENESKEDKPKKKGYFNLLNREGPKALGSRPEPVGSDNCLDGKVFVISGEFDTLLKDQTKDIIMRYGGRVTTGVSGKTTYLLRGRDAGESKLAKAKQCNTKVLDEDGFYELVESSVAVVAKKPVEPEPPVKKPSKGKNTESSKPTPTETETLLWTEKYKPQTIQEIIGNKEMIKKIAEWLDSWKHGTFDSIKTNENEIKSYRAVIISGPPGIGKTTAAHVIAHANGYDPLELNASDVRNKKSLEQALSGMMYNRSVTEYYTNDNKKETDTKLKGKKIVLIMDEVDGMSSGDRGGAVELAAQIKKSKIPVICICNDIRSTKVTPLLRVCFDARFRRTPANQIRSKIMSIAHKEKLDIKPNAVDELVTSTQNDVRQIINILSTYRLQQTSMAYDDAKKIGKANNKNTILNLFEIPGELFSPSNWRQKNLNQLSEIYFHDYNLSPLMIQENYLKSKPQKAGQMTTSGNPREMACNEMDLIAKASEAIADGDMVDRMIHGSTQQYSLMPVHSVFSCVRPAYYMEGHFQTKTGFPSWLGQNSKAGKNARLLSELHSRMRVRTSGDKSEIRQNYISVLNERIFGNIKQENFGEAVEYMDNYFLDRESLETLNDVVCISQSNKGPMIEIPTKTKTAFTRKYNSERHPVLFQAFGEPIKKRTFAQMSEDMVDTLVEEEPEIEEIIEEEEEVNGSKFIREKSKTSEPPKRKRKISEDPKPAKKARKL